jgi:hypothetical protein
MRRWQDDIVLYIIIIYIDNYPTVVLVSGATVTQ